MIYTIYLRKVVLKVANIKKYIAEFLGTFVLVFTACGAALSGMDKTGVALAFGLVIVAMAFAIGNISGCHINPAVSIAMLIDGQLNVVDFLCYLAAQFTGAIAGAGMLAAIIGDADSLSGCSNGYVVAFGEERIFASFVVELILTFIFVFVIMRVTAKAETAKNAGLYIGAALTLVHLVGIGFTGTSVNPARSFGPALFAGGAALEQYWVFLLAPLAGGALAAIVAKFFKKAD